MRPPACRRATRRCASWSPGGSRCTGSCSATSCRSSTSTAPTARVDATREAAKLVASIRDRSKVEAFARELAGMVGVDIDDVRAEVRRAREARRKSAERNKASRQRSRRLANAPSDVPDPRERRFSIERDVLKLALQHRPRSPTGAGWSDVEARTSRIPTTGRSSTRSASSAARRPAAPDR